jgi:hypothetical protein
VLTNQLQDHPQKIILAAVCVPSKLSMPCLHASSRTVRNCLTYGVSPLPVFLCPVLLRFPKIELSSQSIVVPKRQQTFGQVSRLHTGIRGGVPDLGNGSVDIALLPVSCPGCGALVQTIEPHEAGFYSATRKVVGVFTTQKGATEVPEDTSEDLIYKAALQNAKSDLLQEMGLANLSALSKTCCSNRFLRLLKSQFIIQKMALPRYKPRAGKYRSATVVTTLFTIIPESQFNIPRYNPSETLFQNPLTNSIIYITSSMQQISHYRSFQIFTVFSRQLPSGQRTVAQRRANFTRTKTYR